MPRPDAWTRDQQLIALRLYMRTPFGRLHGRNPQIIAALGGTPDPEARGRSAGPMLR
jgi:hypothetical protein